MGMTYTEFKKRLRQVNPRLLFKPTKRRSSGIYLYLPRHPDVVKDADDWILQTNASGELLHLCSMPSPRLFSSIPKLNQFETVIKRKLHPVFQMMVDVPTRRLVARGYQEFGRILLAKRATLLGYDLGSEQVIRRLFAAAA